jgi:hypothetical protein
MKGTKFNRLLFQLVPKTHRTEEIDVGLLLPTPNTCDAYNANNKDNHDVKRGYLRGFASMKMLPTPKAREAEDCLSERNRHTPSMESLAAMGMLPTPTAQIIKHGHTEKYWDNRIGKRQMDIAMWNAQTNGKLPNSIPGL